MDGIMTMIKIGLGPLPFCTFTLDKGKVVRRATMMVMIRAEAQVMTHCRRWQ